MELEKQRGGISISSTVLQFDYNGRVVNLLDTPGHKDFSEDTYRVLTAVDAVLMVIDAAKGVEAQTRKLFEVCRRRGIPIFTFMNKCDRPTRNPIALLDELEAVLGIQASPVIWPLGNGPSFRGVFDRRTRQVHLFERVPAQAPGRAPRKVASLGDPVVRAKLDDTTFEEVGEQLAMLEGAGHPFDLAAVRAGKQTPVFFGSAVNNFGIQLLLDGFLEDSIPPQPRSSVTTGSPVEIPVTSEKFSAFVFKIQANMGTRGTATGSPSCACVLGEVRAGHGGPCTPSRAGRCGSPRRTSSLDKTVRRSTSPGPETSSASWATTPLASATR